MSVEFNAESGQAHLDRVTFDALVALAGGSDPPARGVEKAQAAGMLRGSSIHPAIRPAIAAAADPVANARLEMHNEEGTNIVVECWVSTAVATYLVNQGQGDLEVVTTTPGFFPESIARLVGLSPRPRTAFQPWRMPIELVDDTFCADPERRRTATTTVAAQTNDDDTIAYTDVLATGPWWHWSLVVNWPGAPDSDGVRSMDVVDTQLGMAMMSLSDELVAVDPTHPRQVFLLLTAILHRDDELAFGLS